MIKKTIIWFGIVLSFLLLIPVLIYIISFNNHEISTDSSHWGMFGDYFGGITNPIIGVVNVLALVYLTLKIAAIDSENKLKEQTQRINENLDAIRLTGFKELNTFFTHLIKILASNKVLKEEERYGLRFEFHGIIHPYVDLFDTFNDLDRINLLGDKLMELEEERTYDENTEIMTGFANLLNDLRIEIKTITTANK